MHGIIRTTKLESTLVLSAFSISEFRNPSNTVLAFVSPGCTLAVTNMVFRREA